MPQGAEALIMERIGKVARIIVMAIPNSNSQAIRQLMSQAQSLGSDDPARTQRLPGNLSVLNNRLELPAPQAIKLIVGDEIVRSVQK